MRLAMGVAYRGTHYYGWQKQQHSNNTIQYHVEKSLSQLANHPIDTVCAGRTDTGVHSTGQVIHFDTHAIRDLLSWKKGTNTNLPYDIRICWVLEVALDFHARFSADYRRYQYIIADNCSGNAIFNELITPCRYLLDAEKMHHAAQYLVGEQDFSSFRAAQCQSKTAFRHIDFIRVYRNKGLIIVDIRANAFLYHMVRNIVGALITVGRGKYPPEWLAALLAEKNRNKAPATAIAKGLYLVEVGYQTVYNIPVGGESLPFV